MSIVLEISILVVSTIFNHVNMFLTSLSEVIFTPEAGSGVAFALALAAGAVVYTSFLSCIFRNI
jgi:hypothetical protein